MTDLQAALWRQARALEAQARQRAPRAHGRLMESARRYVEGGIVTPPRQTPFFPVFPLRLTEPERPKPPCRAVLDVGDGLFEVEASSFATTDRVLAEAVAREFDRIDPLPGFVYPSIGTERTIRERRERGAAIAEVWRQRQAENDARWERDTQRLRALREEIEAATTLDEVEAALDRVRRP